MNTRAILSILAILSALAFSAHAETIRGISINKLPAIIKKPGIYVLKKSLKTTQTNGAAITILVDHVTIDLNDNDLSGPAGTGAVDSTTFGIQAKDCSFIHIRNGSISGFNTGVSLENPTILDLKGHVLEDLHIQGAATSGMVVNGLGAKVRRCSLTDTGLATGDVYGILLQGQFGEISECSVLNTRNLPPQIAHCIAVFGAGTVIRDNQIGNSGALVAGTLGIQTDSALIVGNSISGMSFGIYANFSSSKLLNNLTSNCGTAFNGGTLVTGNN